MAPFFTGSILLLRIEHVLFPSNKLLVRHVTWSISNTSIGYCCACHEIYTTIRYRLRSLLKILSQIK